MSDNSRILSDSVGDPKAAEKLLPLIYDELRRLAASKMAGQPVGHSLQATALVHEAYLRLVKSEPDREWECRGQFFVAAAEAMRRILIDRARHKQRVKHGGELARQRFAEDAIMQPTVEDLNSDLLDIDAAIEALQAEMPRKAELIKLRFFVGLTSEESADLLGISRATAARDWTFARAWIIRYMNSNSTESFDGNSGNGYTGHPRTPQS